MTLLDVLKLGRHYIKMVVIVVVVCTLAGAGLGVAKAGLGNAEYSAEAVLTISEPTATVSAGELMPLAQAIATNVVAENSSDGVTVSQTYDLASRTIAFTAVASSETESIEAANNAARQTADETAALLREIADQYRSEIQSEESAESKELDGTVTFGLSERNRAAALEMVSFTVNDASQAAINSGKSTVLKYMLVGFVGGLLLDLCLVSVINFTKRPLKSQRELEECLRLPVLAKTSDSAFAQRLGLALGCMTDDKTASACILLVGCHDSQFHNARESFVEEMASASKVTVNGKEISMEVCAPFDQCIESMLVAHNSQIVVLVASPWVNTLTEIEETVAILDVLKANLVGSVLDDAFDRTSDK